MAQFADITITRTGLDMIAKSQTGDKLIFTGIKIGDGQIDAQSIPDMTDLINFKQDMPINSVTAKENGHAEIIGIIDNENLDVGFFVREIGIFAKINDGGTPALYGYANAGNLASYISDKSIPMDAIKFKIDIVVGNSENVSFTSDKSIVYVTQENLDAHNVDKDSHPDIRQKITTDIADHNTSNTAHQDIRQKITDLGNPVVNVEEKGGVVNVTKSNGDKNQFYSGLNILQRNKEYAVGDIAYSASLPSWAYLECVTAGTTGATEPDFSTVTGGGLINDGTAKWEVRNLQKAYDLREIVNFLFPVGTVVSIATTTKPSYMQYGTWTEIASGRVLMGGNNPGETIEAGLPNITGEVGCFRTEGNYSSFTEVFAKGSTLSGGAFTGSREITGIRANFNASRSSSVYGRSSTVQPPAYVVKFYRRTA